MLVVVIPQFLHYIFVLKLRLLHIIPGVINIIFKSIGWAFKVSANPIPWLVSVLVETETGQSTGSCMLCHLR